MVHRWMVVVGLSLILIGVVLVCFGFVLRHNGLPGDILIRRNGLLIYIPITTSLLLSVLLSLLAGLVWWMAGHWKF